MGQQISNRDWALGRHERHNGIVPHRNCRLRKGRNEAAHRIVEADLPFLYKRQDRHARNRLCLRGDTENRIGRHPPLGFFVTPPNGLLIDRLPVLQYQRHCTGDTTLVYVLLQHAVDACETFWREPDLRCACQRGRSPRPKPCRLAGSVALRTLVATKLARNWSPQQIAGWLTRTFPDDPCLHVSHETIYRSLFVQSRGVLKRELIGHLRRRPRIRRTRPGTRARHRRGGIPDAVSIRARPATVADRAVPGHWEGDLLTGGRHSYIATLVERQSRFVVLVRLANKETHTVVAALTTAVRALPAGFMASLTWDRGMELAAHHRFTVTTNVQVYFCDPQSPWQRGTNENTNGLLRQYFPKGTDLSSYTQADLDAVALQLNTRPRKTLGYATPADRLAATVASTG